MNRQQPARGVGPAFAASTALRWLGTAAMVVAAPFAQAAHPSLVEDAGTQGAGRFELELGMQQERDRGMRSFEFGPQLSYGVAPTIDLILRPSWLDQRASPAQGSSRERGTGDTAVDCKWRLFEGDARSVGVRAGVDLPTGDWDRGLGAGKASYHGLLIVSFDAEPWSFSLNAGYVYHRPTPEQRRDTWVVGGAAVWIVQDGFKLTADVGAERNADPARSTWPATVRIGAIYTVDAFWDLDIGYQARLNHAAPEHVLLAGATLRW